MSAPWLAFVRFFVCSPLNLCESARHPACSLREPCSLDLWGDPQLEGLYSDALSCSGCASYVRLFLSLQRGAVSPASVKKTRNIQMRETRRGERKGQEIRRTEENSRQTDRPQVDEKDWNTEQGERSVSWFVVLANAKELVCISIRLPFAVSFSVSPPYSLNRIDRKQRGRIFFLS